MAITYSDKFAKDCKAAFQEAMRLGDKQRAEEIRRYYEERKYDMDDDYMRGMLGQTNAAANSILGSPYQQAIAQQALIDASGNMGLGVGLSAMQNATFAKSDFKPEFGVLYLHNKELPADWSGAKITEFQRRADQKWWHVQFRSKWDKALEINLYLDVEEHNGKEINEMARTYIEALNQRRVG